MEQTAVMPADGYAHPRIHTDEMGVRSYPLTAQAVIATVPMTLNGDGSLKGVVHIPPDHLSRIMGQADGGGDLVNLSSAFIESASTNVAAPVGVVWSHGSSANGTETAVPFGTVDRVFHVSGDSGNVTACHAVVPQACGTGLMSQFKLGADTTVAFCKSEAARNNTRFGVGRALRWAGKTTADLSHTVTKVSSNGQTRYMIPNTAPDTKCAMSQLFDQNKHSPDFCRGAYHENNRTNMQNQIGQQCTVVTEADFDNISKQLSDRLTQQSPVATHGLTLTCESLGSNDATIHSEMTTAGFAPTVTVRAVLNRIPTNEMMASTETHAMAASPETTSDFHAYLGEKAADHIASDVPMDFASHVLSATLQGEATAVPVVAASNDVSIELLANAH